MSKNIVLRRLEQIALMQLAALLLLVHATAVWVWLQSSVWPRYKAPTSWSVPPIANLSFLYSCAVMWILFNLVRTGGVTERPA